VAASVGAAQGDPSIPARTEVSPQASLDRRALSIQALARVRTRLCRPQCCEGVGAHPFDSVERASRCGLTGRASSQSLQGYGELPKPGIVSSNCVLLDSEDVGQPSIAICSGKGIYHSHLSKG
jgi:hypothetical protein